MASSTLGRLAGAIEGRVRNAVAQEVNRRLPAEIQLNPHELDAEPDDSDDDGDDDDQEGDHDPAGAGGGEFFLHIATPDADHNLATAAAAWRVLGEAGDVVAQNQRNGEAFFGEIEDLGSLAQRRAHKPEDWIVWGKPSEIMELDYDSAAIRRVLTTLDQQEDGFEAARKQYEKFSWGQKANGISVVSIPGITCPLSVIGVARRVDYGSDKGGSWNEYFHEHGEESGEFPMIYAGPVPPGEKWPTWYVVHGGKMRIEDRGITD